jgi:hypothetical protein
MSGAILLAVALLSLVGTAVNITVAMQRPKHPPRILRGPFPYRRNGKHLRRHRVYQIAVEHIGWTWYHRWIFRPICWTQGHQPWLETKPEAYCNVCALRLPEFDRRRSS